ncbi:hypothetical protein DFS34DRAFT_432529 [Phlyctochytrium arcticum]|nr:hypothetical protein DFS34DRAFT_432529 [Phlyctochytrium arcticum]
MGWMFDGARLCPLCGICIENIYGHGPEGSWVDRDPATKIVRPGDGIWFQWAVGLFDDFVTPVGKTDSDITPGQLYANNINDDPQTLDGTNWVNIAGSGGRRVGEPVTRSFSDAAEDSDEDAAILPFRNPGRGGYQSWAPESEGGCIAVHVACLSLACAWSGIPSDRPLDFFTHPSGEGILTCSCLSRNYDYGIGANTRTRAQVWEERRNAGLLHGQYCQFGIHHLHEFSPSDGRYFNAQVLFHDINFEVRFEMAAWFGDVDKGEWGIYPPMEPADEWVLVRPDRFPSLHNMSTDNDKCEGMVTCNPPLGLLPRLEPTDPFARLPLEVKLLIFQFVMQVEEESDKGDMGLVRLQCTNRYWNSCFNSRESSIQLHYKTRCAAMGLIPTESDTRRSGKAIRAALTQNVNNVQSDWSRYYKDCKHSRSMRNRHRIFRTVKKIFRIIHFEEFRTKETHPDHLYPGSFLPAWDIGMSPPWA